MSKLHERKCGVIALPHTNFLSAGPEMSFPYEKATFWMLLLIFLSAAYGVYAGMNKVKAVAAANGVNTDV